MPAGIFSRGFALLLDGTVCGGAAVATAPEGLDEWWESLTGLRYRFVSYRRAAR